MAIVADAGLRSHPILASGARGPARRVLGAARPLRACAGPPRGRGPARSHTPLAERRAPAHAQSGGPAQVHTPLAGRRGTGHVVVGGPAWVHAPLREARRRSCCGGRTGAGARSLTGGAATVALWRADRRRCTLPCGRRSPVHAQSDGPAQVHTPLAGRRGTGHVVVGGPAWVHAPLREARRGSRCGGRTGAGARSLTGGAARVALWWADRRRCTLPYGRRSPVGLWWADRRRCTLPCGRRGT